MLLKKVLLLVGVDVLICCCLIFAANMSVPNIAVPTESERPHIWPDYYISNLQFIDGGANNDTIIATVINKADEAFTVTAGYIAQNYWLDNGFVYRTHEQAGSLFGDLNVPANATKDIYLTLPTNTLIAGKTYSVELNTTNPHPFRTQHTNSPNWFNTISTPQAFTFYHMGHPNTKTPVEEGVITSLSAAFCDANYADSMHATIQNTGDFPITIIGGFVNGNGAINTTDARYHSDGIEQCVIEKNSSGSVTLNFPAGTLYNTIGNPFNVKLVTAQGNIIEGADLCYSFDFSPSGGKVPQTIYEKEQAQITTLRFFQKYGMYDSITATVENLGSKPITITSCLLNGKATTILSNNSIVEGGKTQTFTIQADPLVQESNYQVVMVTSENNAFIKTSTYHLP